MGENGGRRCLCEAGDEGRLDDNAADFRNTRRGIINVALRAYFSLWLNERKKVGEEPNYFEAKLNLAPYVEQKREILSFRENIRKIHSPRTRWLPWTHNKLFYFWKEKK